MFKKFKSKNIAVTLSSVVLIVSLCVVGWFGQPTVSSAQEKPEYTFAVVAHYLPVGSFFAVFYQGMMDACKRYNVKGVYLGSKVSGDVGEMLGNLELTIPTEPDGIACFLTDARVLDEPLRKAIKVGIPVIALNVKDTREPAKRIPYLRYVGEDSYQSGALAAKGLVKEFTRLYGRAPKRSVFAIHEPGNVVQEMRAQGAMDVLKEAGVKVTDKLDVTLDPAKVSESIRAYVSAHPDCESIHTGNIEVAHWIVQTLEELGKLGNINEPGKPGKVFVAGIDIYEEGLQDIKDGKITCTIDQQPYLQGYFGIQLLYLWNKYRLLPANDISTGPYVVDKTNVDEFLELIKLGVR